MARRASMQEQFGLTPQQTGAYLASMTVMQSVSATFTGSVETVLIKRGWPTIDIRRYSSTVAFAVAGCGHLIYGRLRTPSAAIALRMVTQFVGSFHAAGQGMAPREMGGEDAGLFMAWMNSIGASHRRVQLGCSQSP
jgi:hypothetical protein